MIACSPIRTCMKNVMYLSACAQRQMTSWICGPLGTCCLSAEHLKPKYSKLSILKTNHCVSVIGFQVFHGGCFWPSVSKQRCNFQTSPVRHIISTRRPLKTYLGKPLWSKHTTLRRLVSKREMIPKIRRNVEFSSWMQGFVPAVILGLLVSFSSRTPVHAEALQAKKNTNEDFDSSSGSHSHGKQVYTDYSIIGIPGDGRCMFCSVAHGACVRLGKPAPNERIQRELADELRENVADEFVKRRKETEWFIEGDFDAYVSQLRKPHVWGGEPELLMASHVLQMPITVFMYDKDSGGLISIAEYGQEYGKENPIKVLYNGFGHYDALQIHEKNSSRSRL